MERERTGGPWRLEDRWIGWGLFLFASVIYIVTGEPTVSFWDCGEYIATAFKLQVGHPPGAPLFQMLGRLFSMIAMGDNELVARMINTLSAVSSGLTVMLLYWTITWFADRLVGLRDFATDRIRSWVVSGSGLIGALTYTFTDSFWFSAVEGEVYALSSFFTALTFYAVLRWERDRSRSNRWLVLISYLVGLSIGVHLLNLLAIPAIALVIYFREKNEVNRKGIVSVLVLSFVLLAVILYGVIPEILSLFAVTELHFVNDLHLPFTSGTLFFTFLLVSFVLVGLWLTHRPGSKRMRLIFLGISGIVILLFLLESSSFSDLVFRLAAVSLITGLIYKFRSSRVILNMILLSFTFILVGYSSFLMLVIRSNAGTPINENSPTNAVNLLAYLNREQYGTYPLFYGQYYNAPIIDYKDGEPLYGKDEESGKYVVLESRENQIPVYDPDYETIFPRMWNGMEPRYIQHYKQWAGIKNDPGDKHIPTFGENLRFFFRYQVDHMYLRYLMWNFVGRQNDIQGNYGDVLYGNWKSGINLIDEMRLGPVDELPGSLQNKADNSFYFLPLLLTLAGLFFHFRRKSKDALVVLVLFFMTGLAIVLYLNQQAPQPRERDYAYAASFYAFAIWTGIGFTAFADWVKRSRPGLIMAFVISLLAVPTLMAVEGWDDHDRSGRYTAKQMAANYLYSCPQNAILFTNGDNDTFPLWYAQEVEGIRTDVRVVNLSLLQAGWYIDQMKKKVYDSDPVPFTLPERIYRTGSHDITYLIDADEGSGAIEVSQLMDLLVRDESKLKFNTGNALVDIFPAREFTVPVDRDVIIEKNILPSEDTTTITDIRWRINRPVLYKNYLMVLDLVGAADWDRPVCFATTTGPEAYLDLEDYLQMEGLAYRLAPVYTPSETGYPEKVATEAMYDNVMNKFSFDVSDPSLYLDDDNKRMANSLRNCYARLASSLILEGEVERALSVADRCLELIPDRAITLNYFSMPLAEVYYVGDRPDDGDTILTRLIQVQEERLEYYFAFDRDKRKHLISEMRESLAMLNAISELAGNYDRQDLSETAAGIFEYYGDRFISSGYASN